MPYWTSKNFGNGKLSLQIHSKSCWSYLTTLSTFEKGVAYNLQKNPVRHYWKVKNFDYVNLHSKNFWSKFTNKIKNRCKFWRSSSTPWTKSWLVRKSTVASNRIFVPRFKWLREAICPNSKRDCFYSFWSRTFPRVFIWL